MMVWIGIVTALVLFALICRHSLFAGTMVFLGALPSYLIRFDIGPVPTTLLEALFAVLFIAWLVRVVRDREFFVSMHELRRRRDVRLIGLGSLLLLLGGILGLSQTSDVPSTLGILKSYVVEPIVFGWILLHVFWYKNGILVTKGTRDIFRASVQKFAIALAIPAAIISVWAIVQWATGITIPVEWFVLRRATSIFPYPNAVGHFVAPVVVFLFATLLSRKPRPIFERSLEVGIVLTIGLGILAMIASQTEAALVGTIVAMAVGAFFLIDRPIKQRVLVGGAAFILFLSVILIMPPLRGKILLQDWSGQTRTAQWSETWNLLTSSPRTFVLGAGADDYPTAVLPFHTHEYFEIFQYPHNIVLNVWVELGLFGLLGFAVIAAAIGHSWLRGNRLAILASLPLFEMTVHGIVDVPYFKNDLALMTFAFIALWLLASMTRPSRAHVPNPPPARKASTV